MRPIRFRLLLPMGLMAGVLSGCAAPTQPPTPALNGPAPGSPVQTWEGTIDCDPVPGMAERRLREQVTLTVSDNQARFARDVYRGNTNGLAGVQEVSTGPVGADGTVVLTGSAGSATWSYDARYEGRLPPGGTRARLTGVQHWRGTHIRPVDRACTLTLRR